MSDPITAEFPPVSTEQWEEVIQKDLKGADYNKKLLWQTGEQITVHPYYRAADLAGLEYLDPPPGAFPFARGASDTNSWRIREHIPGGTPEEANPLARRALEAGAEEVSFAVVPRSVADVRKLLDGLDCPIHFKAGEAAESLLRLLVEARADLAGSLDYVPGDVVLVRAAKKAMPRFRPVKVQASAWRDAGSTILQELAFGLAEGIAILARLTDAGMPVREAADSVVFSFAAGLSYFLEISKLRAARLLWARIVESFEPGAEAKMSIEVRTAHQDRTVYDPYVNLLRGTTAAMSAAIGGCDSLRVEPFDSTYRTPDEFSLRLARNTQVILKKEAGLERVADPAGGAYYLEVLTDSLAREAWKLIQEMEAAGGYDRARLVPQVEASRKAKEAAVASRRKTVLGTNQYPNLTEHMLDLVSREDTAPRASRVFEEIRLRTERSGRAPLFLLLESGDVKMRKARAGFAANFFGCAGFAIEHASEIQEALDRNPDAIVLCSSDTEYPALAAAVIEALKKAGRATPVIVAGNPESAEALRAAGVADFVHVRSNAAEVLRKWQDRLGVKA